MSLESLSKTLLDTRVLIYRGKVAVYRLESGEHQVVTENLDGMGHTSTSVRMLAAYFMVNFCAQHEQGWDCGLEFLCNDAEQYRIAKGLHSSSSIWPGW